MQKRQLPADWARDLSKRFGRNHIYGKLSCSHLVSLSLSQMDGAATDPNPDTSASA